MAKHPHKLILMSKKTWKCALTGCSFFVHLGLAHVLIGKAAICWDCESPFEVSETSLTEDKPRCNECRTGMSEEELSQFIDTKMGEKN